MQELHMRGSDREIPDPLEHWESHALRDAKPDGWWLAEGAFFNGNAWPLNGYGELSAAQPISSGDDATAAFCVTRGRLLAIVSPNNRSDPAIWIATACSRLRVDTEEASTPRGNTTSLTITGSGWTLRAIEISRLYRHMKQKGTRAPEISERFQTGQARSFAQAVESASTTVQPEAIDPSADAPPASGGYEWVRDHGLGGLYRLVRVGKPTSATSLVNRELPVDEQVRELEAIDWVPKFYLTPIIEATRDGKMPKLFRPELLGGRLNPPLLRVYLSVLLDGRAATHPVNRYLWPSLDGEEPSLDAGETIAHTWRAPAVRLARFSSPDDRGVGVEFDSPGTPDPTAYLTNRRLIVIAKRDPSKITAGDARRWWGAHLRYEWISEIGVIEKTAFKRTMLRAKPTGHDVSFALYARLVLAAGVVNEVSFPGLTSLDDAARAFVARLTDDLASSDATRTVGEETSSSSEATFATTVRRYRRVDGAVPYSLPSSFA